MNKEILVRFLDLMEKIIEEVSDTTAGVTQSGENILKEIKVLKHELTESDSH